MTFNEYVMWLAVMVGLQACAWSLFISSSITFLQQKLYKRFLVYLVLHILILFFVAAVALFIALKNGFLPWQ